MSLTLASALYIQGQMLEVRNLII